MEDFEVESTVSRPRARNEIRVIVYPDVVGFEIFEDIVEMSISTADVIDGQGAIESPDDLSDFFESMRMHPLHQGVKRLALFVSCGG
jgi:hypothetical protein